WQRFVVIQKVSQFVFRVPFFAVVEDNDRLGAGDGRCLAGVVQNLGDGGPAQVVTFGQPIPFAQRLGRFGAHRRQRVDGRAIFLVGHDAAVHRIGSRGDGSPIDFGGT